MNFVKLMTSPLGRGARIILGIVLISVGQLIVKDMIGNIISVVALIPIAGGVFDFCLAGLALGYPFNGAKAREQIANKG